MSNEPLLASILAYLREDVEDIGGDGLGVRDISGLYGWKKRGWLGGIPLPLSLKFRGIQKRSHHAHNEVPGHDQSDGSKDD